MEHISKALNSYLILPYKEKEKKHLRWIMNTTTNKSEGHDLTVKQAYALVHKLRMKDARP